MTKRVSEYFSDDKQKSASVGYSPSDESYYIDFYENKIYLCSRWYWQKSSNYVEDAAENYVQNILNLKDLINGDREGNI